MQINFKNIEEVIFYNDSVWKKIPDLIHLRDQWRISKMTPMLKAMGRKAMLDFLRTIKPHHEEAISEHFKEYITIDRIEHNLVVNKEFTVDDDHVDFDLYENFTGFSTYRNSNKVFITFWR
jgi:hypothetical protein